MNVRSMIVAGLSVVTAGIAGAQTGSANACPAGGSTTTAAGAQANIARDACLQAVDLFQFMAPQLGLALTGGNTTPGQGGTLGGIGHFVVAVRGNVFTGDLPKVADFPAPRNQNPQTTRQLPSETQLIGLPVVDAAIGIFRGIPLGLTNVGGVDLLVNAAYVPSVGKEGDDFRMDPQTNVKFGFGARVGLLQESLVVPGVSATFIKRDLPTTD